MGDLFVAIITSCNDCYMSDWLILTATLPTSPSALRVRIWRQLRATHAAHLREGVYILPAHAPTAANFRAMDLAIREAGALSHLLEVPARDDRQAADFVALFDRSAAYAVWAQDLKAARQAQKTADEALARQALRDLEQRLLSVLVSDFFPGEAAAQAQAGLKQCRNELDRRFSPDEPQASEGTVHRLAVQDFQGRTWATRARPWVDRLASAWLIQRFIDAAPRFKWLRSTQACPKSALGFDFDGARFSHVGDRVTFEVLVEAFGLSASPALQSLGELVHAIDVGGLVVDEAVGVERLVRGLQRQHADDDRLLAAAIPLFDALYSAYEPAKKD
jgi:hypothetical protein